MSESTNSSSETSNNQATGKSEQSFAELFSQGPKSAKEGEVARGIVLSIDDEFVQVDIGFKSEGLVAAWEFMEDDGTMSIKVGFVDRLLDRARFVEYSQVQLQTHAGRLFMIAQIRAHAK